MIRDGERGICDGKDAHQPQQEEFAVDYGLYQSFWRLQEYALKPDAAIKGDKTKDTWKAILHDVDKVGHDKQEDERGGLGILISL